MSKSKYNVHTPDKLIEKFGEQIIIMPGGGLTQDNLGVLLSTCSVEQKCEVLSPTKLGIKEFHASARVSKKSNMIYRNESLKMGSDSQEYTIMVASSEKVKKMVDIFTQYSTCL